MIRPILSHPDPVLRRRCAPVGAVSDGTRTLIRDLTDTMYHAGASGLSAPELGVLLRVFVVDGGGPGAERAPVAFVDPRVVAAAREVAVSEETCPSVPGRSRRVARPRWIALRWTDPTGALREGRFEGAWAVEVQHEADHLDGRLILDHDDAGPPAEASR